MKKFDLRHSGAPFSANPAFREATAEELRVLLVFLELRRAATDEEIASLAGVSPARASSAATLWREAGILTEAERAPAENTVTDVYAEHIDGSALMEESGEKLAEVIRREKLASLFIECARMMEKPMLSAAETRRLAALVSQYGLSPEYIAILAAHLAEWGKLSVTSLVNRAIHIADRGITSEKALQTYLADQSRENESLYELKKLFGIRARSLSATERETFLRWTGDFGFSQEIIGEAYDIAVVRLNEAPLKYMDKILTHWHEAGCKTLAEVRALCEKESAEAALEREKNKPQKPSRAKKEPQPRYGNFDPEEALQAALSRSYGDKK